MNAQRCNSQNAQGKKPREEAKGRRQGRNLRKNPRKNPRKEDELSRTKIFLPSLLPFASSLGFLPRAFWGLGLWELIGRCGFVALGVDARPQRRPRANQ